MPMVPGPDISARTFTIEKAPPMIPKPRPETGYISEILYNAFA